MPETNKTLRIKTDINGESSKLFVNLEQSYNTFEILSLKLNQSDMYKLHSANYGVIVGRVLANGNFGVPNAKISLFIEGNFENEELANIYPYTSTSSQDKDGIRYNLLPDEKVDNCYQVVGTFPNKTYLLDNDVLIEVFENYYKYTTRTNNSGDYIIMGVPVGNQTLHMDLDLSDCGILSQRPRDFVYKGYTIEQFENANQFKKDTNLSSLSQIFSQDQVVNVIPFWGNENQGETIGITRADLNISFKFEPTCVFMGSVVADNASNGISKKCVPTNQMGSMEELTTGEGTIEMIRYTPGGEIEEFQIKGTQLIDGNGIWCYQIPMNLDYMMTDEYGNMVPTDDPEKGIPTRTRVRFRVSMQDMEKNTDNYFRAKVLIPHNPQNLSGTTGEHEDYDYEFGSDTREDSFRDLLWNNVYTVKSYIPRFQKSKTKKDTLRFTGIKGCNHYGNNNPIPYNNIRIKLPLMFTMLCILIKTYIVLTRLMNNVITKIMNGFADVGNSRPLGWLPKLKLFGNDIFKGLREWAPFKSLWKTARSAKLTTLAEGLCPDLENWFFAPCNAGALWTTELNGDVYNMLQQTYDYLTGEKDADDYSDGKKEYEDGKTPEQRKAARTSGDEHSIDYTNSEENNSVCITLHTDYLISCVEMALAQEYKVINFDFYNDWLNGVIYMPRWMRYVRPKRTFLFGLIKIKSKIKACSDDTSIFNKTRYYVQQCSLSYKKKDGIYKDITTANGCVSSSSDKQKCHKKQGKSIYAIFGGSKSNKVKGNGGIVHENETTRGQFVYYIKPCEWRIQENNKKVNLFATDIVLLGSLLDCNLYGIPQAYKYLKSSSYIMPTNLALTNMDDEGQAYAGEEGTICTGREPNTDDKIEPTKNTFGGLAKYYSTADSDEQLKYGVVGGGDTIANVYDDSIPLTEAAGIAWNYTGPGQGEKSEHVHKSLYMPGGHFLGISCVNSETNVKSCVNLERICEIGSNMSQRREEVRKIVGSTNELQYRYFVPTGLISNDEVNGGSFRNMFATMNQNRLLCNNRVDEKTGYPIYDFVYMRTNGFDGSLKSKIKTNEWNTKINVKDEANELSKESGSQISKDVLYDVNETGYTVTRTLEETKQDYYKFRFGLNTLDNDEQLKKFLINDGSSVKLPQYENSFYFYFGLKDGSTAFDEFNKQFFSVCDTSSKLRNKMTVTVTNEELDLCSFTSDFTLSGLYGSGLITGRYEFVNNSGETQSEDLTPTQSINGMFQFDFNLPFGTYKFIITDENGTTIEKTIEVGKGIVKGNFTPKNFEFRTKGLTNNAIIESGKTLDCGYISIENFTYSGESKSWDTIKDNIIVVESETGNYAGKSNIVPDASGYPVYNVFDTPYRIQAWKADASYDIYFVSLEAGGNCNGYTLIGSVFVEGIDNYDLYLGSKLLPYSTELSQYNVGDNWWANIGNDDNANEGKNWAKRYALYRRTDFDDEAFSNNVIALNSKGRVVDTVLFGQPERDDENYNGDYLRNKVFYENDEFDTDVPYSLSDTSIIPTTLCADTFTLTTRRPRALFGEMAINGGTIISDKLITVNGDFASSITESWFTTNDLPSVSSNKILDGHGCIAKLSDDRILYCVKIKNGNRFIFHDDLPDETTAQEVSLYPIFYYPVIYRPFYANVCFGEWLNPSLVLGEDGNLEMNYSGHSYHSTFEIHNGLTYKGKFGKISVGQIVYSDEDITRKSGNTDASYTDLTANSDYELPVPTDSSKPNDVIETITGSAENVIEDSYEYLIAENAPTSGDIGEENYKLLTTPYPIKPMTITDSLEIDFSTYIGYRVPSDAEDVVRFYLPYDDVENDYYLIKENETIKPLKREKYLYVKDTLSRETYHLACMFGPESDDKMKVKKEDGYVNAPGTVVYADITSKGILIPYYKKQGDDKEDGFKIPKSGLNLFNPNPGRQYINCLTGNNVSDTSKLVEDLKNYDITPLFTYGWNDDTKSSVDVYESFKDKLNADNLIDFSIETEVDGVRNNIWTTKENYFIVSVKKFVEEDRRDSNIYKKAVNGKGSSMVYRLYKGFVQLEPYKSADYPYLKLSPDERNGIYGATD